MAPSITVDRDIISGSAHLRVRVRSDEGGWADLARRVAGLGADRHLLVADEDLPEAHVARVLDCLAAPTRVLRVPGSGDAARADLPRPGAGGTEAVVAVGGTRAIRAARLLAAPAGRTAPLVLVPTTLWAVSDSAVTLRGPAGASAPALVWTHLDLLATLPGDAVRSGAAAAVRCVLAAVPAHHDDLADRLRPDARYGARDLASFIALSLDARAVLTAYDPLEQGMGAALGYGEDVGRALRAASGGRLHRGTAAGLGMLVAARLAVRLGLADPAVERAHRELLERAGLPTALPEGTDPDRVLALLGADGAQAPVPAPGSEPGSDGGGASLLLLSDLGRPHVVRGRTAVRVAGADLRAALEDLAAGSRTAGSRTAEGRATAGRDGAAAPVPAGVPAARTAARPVGPPSRVPAGAGPGRP